jgi:hypothetical protein
MFEKLCLKAPATCVRIMQEQSDAQVTGARITQGHFSTPHSGPLCLATLDDVQQIDEVLVPLKRVIVLRHNGRRVLDHVAQAF